MKPSEEESSRGRWPSLERVDTLFRVMSSVFPKRLVDEELGDALEEIRMRMQSGRPAFQIATKLFSTTFWIATRFLLEAVRGLTRLRFRLPTTRKPVGMSLPGVARSFAL